MPGYRNKDVRPDLPYVPACKTNEEFHKGSEAVRTAITALFRDDNDNINMSKLESCYSQCGIPCETWTYQLYVDSNKKHDAKFTDLWRTEYVMRSALRINMVQSKIKVLEEQLTYGLNQMIGEIGGTWGFYLGFSIINMFYFFGQVSVLIKNIRLKRQQH
jgi:hypothetical protein